MDIVGQNGVVLCGVAIVRLSTLLSPGLYSIQDQAEETTYFWRVYCNLEHKR